MEPKFKCFLVSMRTQHDTIDFDADSIDKAVRTAALKIGNTIDDWDRCFQFSGSNSDAEREGLIATYRASPWSLYVHENREG